MVEVNDGARFCRVQCKGRSLINSQSSSINIPTTYVTASFIVFLYIEDSGGMNGTYIFCFFNDDITTNWNLNSKYEYILSFNKNNFLDKLKPYTFNQEKIIRIKSIIQTTNIQDEFSYFLSPRPSSQDSDIVYKDNIVEVSLRKNRIGDYETIIRDIPNDIERIGAKCPGNLQNYHYNPSSDIWSLK